jgi:hypothetical protein
VAALVEHAATLSGGSDANHGGAVQQFAIHAALIIG